MLRERGSAAARIESEAPETEPAAPLEGVRRPSLKPVETQPLATEPVETTTRARAKPSPQPNVEPATLPADAELAPSPPVRSRGRKLLFIFVALAALAGAGWYGNYWWTVGRFIVSTDDAYVGAKAATVAAKVSGYLASVEVDDNAQVRTGDLIAKIDDGDYQLAVQTAKDNAAIEQATIERIGKQIEAQKAAIDQAKAQFASAQAGETRAELELTRQQALAARDFASHQALEQAQASRDQAIAAVKGAEAGVAAAATNLEVLKAQQGEAAQTLKQLRTALAKAERDLSFTVIRAPFDGVIGNRAMQTGDYVQPGQRLASLVPLDAVYIDANFKETQLASLRPGQEASLAVDALPGRTLKGTVVSVAPASGSVFSLLPPDNATGNFTKIVQRVPVRIEVPADVAGEQLLRPGMSVVVSIKTKAEPHGPAPAAVATSTGPR
jgi:membrane fusion protein, multidrug efflux system